MEGATIAARQRCGTSYAGTALLLAYNTAQSTNRGEQSWRFLSVFAITKRNVMVCTLSWFWDETTKIKDLLG
jgi:hypothetical protein